LAVGDITASNAVEEIVAIFIMLVGVLFFSFLISSVSDQLQVRIFFTNYY